MSAILNQDRLDLLPLIELQGKPRKMGRQFGESCRQAINELYEIRLKTALEHAATRGRTFTKSQALSLAGSSVSLVKDFDENIFEECLGIAEGANLSLEEIFILQGLTDFRDYLSWGSIPDGFGCTSMIIRPSRSASASILLAQNWDLSTSNMPYVCMVKRNPKKGPKTLSMTVAGGLCMIGINSYGVAVGTNNIKTVDSRPGVHYLHLIHKALHEKNAADAVATIKNAARMGAHYYLIGDSDNNSCGLECSALKTAELPAEENIITHCNHPLHEDIQALNAEDMGQSTCSRQKRVDSLIKQYDKFSIDAIKTILADHDGDDVAICRHDVYENISTNGSIILDPVNQVVHACRSQPCKAIWQTYNL